MNSKKQAQFRTGRQLYEATKPFAQEQRARSWKIVWTTLACLTLLLLGAALIPWWPVQALCAVFAGLTMVRAFIMFHDYMHGTILRGSKLAEVLMYGIGVLVMTPPRAWKGSHNHHHAHVGKLAEDGAEDPVGSTDVGAFPMMTVENWQRASKFQRLHYRISRHPLTVFCAYLSVFMGTMCLGSLFSKPRKNWPNALIFLAHVLVIAALWMVGGWTLTLFVYLLPLWVAGAAGAYLFYAQHSFPGARVFAPKDWEYFYASLSSASYFKMGPILEWFTGSIGYHHVHHLNAKIPFYRLREAMYAIPELQQPVVTRLRVRDIIDCFQANLWDPKAGRMLSYREA